ncbi:CopD family protein [Microvirga sp. G4-2]|uniref:CopD family protein n=1 Tax=Microvirga sp. G4-2 TaxID=3434467 RepID=UPI004043E91C
MRDLRGASRPVVRRFSAIAVPAVGLMVLAGLVLSIVQLGSPAALRTLAYGRIFAARMVAVARLLALATLNRQLLTSMLTKEAGARHLVRSIVILGLVATWRFIPRWLRSASIHTLAGAVSLPRASDPKVDLHFWA